MKFRSQKGKVTSFGAIQLLRQGTTVHPHLPHNGIRGFPDHTDRGTGPTNRIQTALAPSDSLDDAPLHRHGHFSLVCADPIGDGTHLQSPRRQQPGRTRHRARVARNPLDPSAGNLRSGDVHRSRRDLVLSLASVRPRQCRRANAAARHVHVHSLQDRCDCLWEACFPHHVLKPTRRNTRESPSNA